MNPLMSFINCTITLHSHSDRKGTFQWQFPLNFQDRYDTEIEKKEAEGGVTAHWEGNKCVFTELSLELCGRGCTHSYLPQVGLAVTSVMERGL